MIKPEQVPPAAMYAAWKCMNAGMTLNDAIAAAINAWEGMMVRGPHSSGHGPSHPEIILPLPQEKTDADSQ